MIPQFSAAITGNALIKCGSVLLLTSHALIHARLPEVVPLGVRPNKSQHRLGKKIQLIYLGCVAWSEMLALALAVLDYSHSSSYLPICLIMFTCCLLPFV